MAGKLAVKTFWQSAQIGLVWEWQNVFWFPSSCPVCLGLIHQCLSNVVSVTVPGPNQKHKQWTVHASNHSSRILRKMHAMKSPHQISEFRVLNAAWKKTGKIAECTQNRCSEGGSALFTLLDELRGVLFPSRNSKGVLEMWYRATDSSSVWCLLRVSPNSQCCIDYQSCIK